MMVLPNIAPQPASLTICLVALAAEGIVLNKDGSFQRTARFRGPDLDSAVAAELVAVAGRLNNAFRRSDRVGPFRRGAAARASIIRQTCFPTQPRLLDAERSRFRPARITSPATISPSPICRRPRTPRAPKPGSMRAANALAPIRRKS